MEMDFVIFDVIILLNTANVFSYNTTEKVSDKPILKEEVKTNATTIIDVDDYLAQEIFSFNPYLDAMPKRPTTQAWWVNNQETITLQTTKAWWVTSSNNQTIKKFVPLDSLKNLSLENLLKIVSDVEIFNKTVMDNIISMYGYPKMDEYHNVLEGMLRYIRNITSNYSEKQTSTLTTIMPDNIDSVDKTNIIRALTPRFLSSPRTTTTTEVTTTTQEITKPFTFIKIQPSAIYLMKSTLPGGAEDIEPRPSNLIDDIVITTTTTVHPIFLNVKKSMKLTKNGYCTTFFIHLFKIIATKNYTHTRELTNSLSKNINIAYDSGRFANWFLLDTKIVTFIAGFNSIPSDELAGMATYLHTLLRQRERLLTEDSNYVLRKIDALYNHKEGELLLNLLVHIYDYPHTNMTADEITDDVIHRVFSPYSNKISGPGVINLIGAALTKKLAFRRHYGNCLGYCNKNYFDEQQVNKRASISKIAKGEGNGYADRKGHEKNSQTIANNKLIKTFNKRQYLTRAAQRRNMIKYPKKHHFNFSHFLTTPLLSNIKISKFRARKNKNYKGIPIETEREFISLVENYSENIGDNRSKSVSRHKRKRHREKSKHKHRDKVKKKHRDKGRYRSKSGSDYVSFSSSSSTRELSKNTRHKVIKHLKLKHPELYKKYKNRRKKHKRKHNHRYNHIDLPFYETDIAQSNHQTYNAQNNYQTENGRNNHKIENAQNKDKTENAQNNYQVLQRRFRIVSTRKNSITPPSTIGGNLSKYLTPRYDFTYRKNRHTNLSRNNLRKHFKSNKLLIESSYSDYETELKFNLQDAIRHPHPIVRNDTEHWNGDTQDGRRTGLRSKTILDESSYSDDEGILKSNVYKVLSNKN